MTQPTIFSSFNGSVYCRFRRVPDDVLLGLKNAIAEEGMAAPVESRAFAVWLAAEQQLRAAVVSACNQRRLMA